MGSPEAVLNSRFAARELGAVVTRLRRALRRGIRGDYPWEQLPMAQVELLQCLVERPGLRVGEAAVLLRLAPNTVSTLGAQMTARGLLEANVDSVDKRLRRLSVSQTGREYLRAWQQAHERMLDEALAGLDAAERRDLLAALPALSRLVDELGSQ